MPTGLKGFQKGDLNPSRTEEGRKRSRDVLNKLRQNSKYKDWTQTGINKFWESPKADKERQRRQQQATFRKESPHATNLKTGKYRFKSQKFSTIKKRAWDAWSKHRRQQHADWRGYVSCFTCERQYHWKEMDLGHYKHGKLDFDEMNTNVQCNRCNRWKHGNLDVYTMKLIAKYGFDAVDDLHKRAAQFKGYTRDELYQIIEKYV